ncbi:hypothetical protein C1H71_06860 [Iodobacter fluviatilis]|uniref:Uncharacterized protein n=1 Tax=Iodobacter fluviatilis TaxID=537 RepID=A0A7G3G914_9NEIS|nr:hypothetical protein C1H71_06860 [Iodobacter fluviatilis]
MGGLRVFEVAALVLFLAVQEKNALAVATAPKSTCRRHQKDLFDFSLGSVDVSFTIALSRKMARHKACDEGNNALFPRSITQ